MLRCSRLKPNRIERPPPHTPAIVVLAAWDGRKPHKFQHAGLIKTDVEAPRQAHPAFQRATSPRRQKPITTVEPSPGQEGHTRANFESRASIHAAFALASRN